MGWWSTKRRCVLHLYSLYKYWLCYENGKKELSTSLFRRMQVQNKENKDVQIHKHWIGSNWESEQEPELESDKELEAKLESHFDSE